MKTQLRKGVLEMCVLAILRRQDSYAYDVVQQLGAYMSIGEGTVYPLMRRLQSASWVETYLQESSSGPARKYYRITAAGRTALEDMCQQWRSFGAEVNALLAG